MLYCVYFHKLPKTFHSFQDSHFHHTILNNIVVTMEKSFGQVANCSPFSLACLKQRVLSYQCKFNKIIFINICMSKDMHVFT